MAFTIISQKFRNNFEVISNKDKKTMKYLARNGKINFLKLFSTNNKYINRIVIVYYNTIFTLRGKWNVNSLSFKTPRKKAILRKKNYYFIDSFNIV